MATTTGNQLPREITIVLQSDANRCGGSYAFRCQPRFDLGASIWRQRSEGRTRHAISEIMLGSRVQEKMHTKWRKRSRRRCGSTFVPGTRTLVNRKRGAL